jgi:hypothetical protein
MQSINHSKLFKEVCEFYDILSVSKCGPYFDAPQSLSLDTRGDNPLCGRYIESYYPSKESRFATSAATVITFFDFDENELEHQRMLRLALLKLQSTFSRRGVEVFYKSKLMAYRSPFFIASTKNTKYCLQQYLVDLYRETAGNLLELDFTKWYFFEMDVDRKEDGFKQYGRFLFNLQDQFNDSLKEQEIKRRIQAMERTAKKHNFSEERIQRCKQDILDSIHYQERRFLEITFLEKFHLEEEEFQKLKKIINDYEFSISINDTRKEYPHNRIPDLSLGELEGLIVIK